EPALCRSGVRLERLDGEPCEVLAGDGDDHRRCFLVLGSAGHGASDPEVLGLPGFVVDASAALGHSFDGGGRDGADLQGITFARELTPRARFAGLRMWSA